MRVSPWGHRANGMQPKKTKTNTKKQKQKLLSGACTELLGLSLSSMLSPRAHLHVVRFMSDIKRPSLPIPFYSVLVSIFSLYGPFNCISFHKFSRQLSVFSLRSSGLSSALSVLSTICLFIKVFFSPNPLWLTGLKAPTN